MDLFNYDPTLFSLIVGSHIVSGFAEGEVIKFSRNKESFTLKVGAQGDGTRMRSADRSSVIELTLLSESPSNKFLQDALIADEQTEGGVTLPIMLRNNNTGRATHSSTAGWIKKQPDEGYGEEATNITWMIEMLSVLSLREE